jgi:phospholipid/cholesterol/gamma-HCH transport system substrate-binding protein
MNERVMQFRVGVMVILTMILFAMLIVWFAGLPLLGFGAYTIYVQFSDTPGVSPGTPIQKCGIRIGRVSEIRLTDNRQTPVLVTARIDGNRRLYHNELCRVVAPIFMGDTALEFVRSTDPKLPDSEVEPGETLPGLVAPDSTRVLSNLQQNLTTTIGSVDVASKDIHDVLSRLSRLLEANEQEVTKVISQSQKTLDLMQEALRNANGVLGDPVVRGNFAKSMDRLPKAIEDTDKAATELQCVARAFSDAMVDVRGITRPMSERSASVMFHMDESAKKLDEVMDQMCRFSRDLNNPQGTVGQLVHDRELYQHLNHASRNVEQLTRELGPIIDDLRTFSDKISRHPEVLGVRGAIQRNSGLQ